MILLHRLVLRLCHCLLVENLTIEHGLLEFLLSKHVITDTDKECIQSRPTTTTRNEALLAALRHCPPELEPFEEFIEALKCNGHVFLADALFSKLEATEEEYEGKLDLLPCRRCQLLQYLDVFEVLRLIFQDSLLGEEDYDWLIAQWQVQICAPSKRFNQLLALFQNMETMALPQFQRIAGEVLGRRSLHIKCLARRCRRIDDLKYCSCPRGILEMQGYAETQAIVPTVVEKHKPQLVSGDDTTILETITEYSIKMVRMLVEGDWIGFRNYSRELSLQYPEDRDIEACISIHSLLEPYSMRDLEKGIAQARTVETRIESIELECANFLRISFYGIQAGVLVMHGKTDEAEELLLGKVKWTKYMCLKPDPASAHIHQWLGKVYLHHNRYRRAACTVSPDEKTWKHVENLASVAWEHYKISSRQFPRLYMMKEFVFWSALEFTFIALRVCIAATFYHPGGVPRAQWNSIENCMIFLKNMKREHPLTAKGEQWYYLLRADYEIRKAEVAHSHADEKKHLDDGRTCAEMAEFLARETLPQRPNYRIYAVRRSNLIRQRISNMDRRYSGDQRARLVEATSSSPNDLIGHPVRSQGVAAARMEPSLTGVQEVGVCPHWRSTPSKPTKPLVPRDMLPRYSEEYQYSPGNNAAFATNETSSQPQRHIQRRQRAPATIAGDQSIYSDLGCLKFPSAETKSMGSRSSVETEVKTSPSVFGFHSSHGEQYPGHSATHSQNVSRRQSGWPDEQRPADDNSRHNVEDVLKSNDNLQIRDRLSSPNVESYLTADGRESDCSSLSGNPSVFSHFSSCDNDPQRFSPTTVPKELERMSQVDNLLAKDCHENPVEKDQESEDQPETGGFDFHSCNINDQKDSSNWTSSSDNESRGRSNSDKQTGAEEYHKSTTVPKTFDVVLGNERPAAESSSTDGSVDRRGLSFDLGLQSGEMNAVRPVATPATMDSRSTSDVTPELYDFQSAGSEGEESHISGRPVGSFVNPRSSSDVTSVWFDFQSTGSQKK